MLQLLLCHHILQYFLNALSLLCCSQNLRICVQSRCSLNKDVDQMLHMAVTGSKYAQCQCNNHILTHSVNKIIGDGGVWKVWTQWNHMENKVQPRAAAIYFSLFADYYCCCNCSNCYFVLLVYF